MQASGCHASSAERFDISDLLLVEDQQTANRSLCQCPNFGGMYELPSPASDLSMRRRPCFYVFGLSSGPFDLPLTKMGSRASCVSLAHRHFRGHTPRQTYRTPIGRWSISSSLADSFVRLRVCPTTGRSWHSADISHPSSAQPMQYAPSCWPWRPPRHSHALAPSDRLPKPLLATSCHARDAAPFELHG